MPFCRKQKIKHSLQTPHMQKKRPVKRASLYTSVKGSLTVEAAIALPVFLCALVALLYLFSYTCQVAKTEQELMQTAKTSAVFLNGSDTADPYISLIGTVKSNVPYSWLFSSGSVCPVHAKVRSWVGYTGESFNSTADDEIVYMTPNGTVFHRSRSCSYLNVSTHKISKSEIKKSRNLSGDKYTPCEYCVKKGAAKTTVYITDYGTCYHNSKNCPGLKRTIMAVPRSEVTVRACSKCG